MLQEVQKAQPVAAAADEVRVDLPGVLRGDLGVAAAQGHQGLRGPLAGLADGLAAFLVAGGGDGAAIDDIDVGGVLKGDQGVAAGGEDLLHGLTFVLVHFAPQGVDGYAHGGHSYPAKRPFSFSR